MTNAELNLSFLGGASEIGASCTLLEVGETTLLIDCGIRFDPSNSLPDLSMLYGRQIDAILVTHAHTDHTGGLPAVCETFPTAPIYATPPTIDLTMILLRDALKLMAMGEREGDVPLYGEKQVDRVRDGFVPAHHGEQLTVGRVEITFLQASHILGASMLHLATPAGNVLITGDYSVSSQLTVPALTRPTLPVDLIVTESTYGDRLHEDRDAAEHRLVEQVKSVLDAGGRVLIPAFAVGRAQEILLILKRSLRNGALPPLPVFVDGMVRAVCGVYGRHDRYVSRGLQHEIRKAGHPFFTNGIRPVTTPEERNEVLNSGPCVIVASSGMLSGGASAFYATRLAPNPKDAVLITGYQDEESPGRALLNLADQVGPRQVKIGDQTVDVQCRFEKYGLSAHGDRMQMAGLLTSVRPETIVLVHGDQKAKQSLAKGMSVQDVVLAENGQRFTRSFHRRSKNHPPSTSQIDFETARHLLGPPMGKPVRSRQIAEAWLGRKATADQVNRLVTRLEEYDLVRRDDERRHLLWILEVSESQSLTEEAVVEEALKKDNPKGKLLEFCMRNSLEPPVIETGIFGAFHTATLCLTMNGERLESGEQRASSKKAAEQLAAQAVLRRVQDQISSTQARAVNDAEAQQLKLSNPKGKLIEWCSQHRAALPVFSHRGVVNGFQVKATLEPPDGRVSSNWYEAQNKKIAEQAAAADLLREIQTLPPTQAVSQDDTASGAPDREQAPEPDDMEAPNTPDPMMLLNEMRQLGVIKDFGYETKGQEGSSHQPIFLMVGWTVLDSGERVETEILRVSSTKKGRRSAAAAIVQELRRLGALAAR